MANIHSIDYFSRICVLTNDADADYSPPRTATNSMPMYINHVQCSGAELNLLECSYSKNHSDNDHSKDFGIKCRKGKLSQGSLLTIPL